MSRPPPRSPHTDPLFPYTTLFRPNAPDRSSDRTAQAPAALRRGHRPVVRRAVLLLPADLRTSRRTAARLSAGRRDDDRHWRRLALPDRSEGHTSELQSLMRISYAVFCLKKKHKKLII